mgnify:CR=1 FL=1
MNLMGIVDIFIWAALLAAAYSGWEPSRLTELFLWLALIFHKWELSQKIKDCS